MIENTQRAESVGLPERWAEVMIECNEITAGGIRKAKELYILRRTEAVDRYRDCLHGVYQMYTFL